MFFKSLAFPKSPVFPKKLVAIGVLLLIIVNGSIFGTIYMVDLLAGPTPEELVALKKMEEKAALDAIYAELPPLEAFKSKAKYIHSISEAIDICEKNLRVTVPERKSWEVNMIESRHIRAQELYKIFIEYQTVATIDVPSKTYDVTCEVSGETREIGLWKPTLVQ